MNATRKRLLATFLALAMVAVLAVAGCGRPGSCEKDDGQADDALVLEDTVWEATRVNMGGERMSMEEFGERQGYEAAYYIEFESDDEANWIVLRDGAVDEGLSATLDYELDDGELTFDDYQGVELEVTSLKPEKMKVKLVNGDESVTITYVLTDLEPGDVEDMASSASGSTTTPAHIPEPGPEPSTDIAPAGDNTSDEELLAIANAEVLDNYNFAMYLAAGAVFETDWSVADESGMWHLVTDDRIHSLSDIEDVWHTYFAPSSEMPEIMLQAFKEEDGAVWSGNMGVGDNFTTIELTTVLERSGNTAVLSGERYLDLGDGPQPNGIIACVYVYEEGAWQCQTIELEGDPWGFV